ncbi:hypothetical protein EXN66_Car018330 [Channa argus]|uniref:Uncharacterized protein n=1 Tax=Channa argus TaxID=215402 RepID=A0A6G1QJB7_CHAAH|nr:hypothetical protein EXN66_Car018330 [Channa argus]
MCIVTVLETPDKLISKKKKQNQGVFFAFLCKPVTAKILLAWAEAAGIMQCDMFNLIR